MPHTECSNVSRMMPEMLQLFAIIEMMMNWVMAGGKESAQGSCDEAKTLILIRHFLAGLFFNKCMFNLHMYNWRLFRNIS